MTPLPAPYPFLNYFEVQPAVASTMPDARGQLSDLVAFFHDKRSKM